jgi:stage III sporulation protein AA
MGIRAMSPEVIIVDEIATPEDLESVKAASDSGVVIIASMHASSIKEAQKKLNISDIFTKTVLISRKGDAND